jgi:hypothetical protein
LALTILVGTVSVNNFITFEERWMNTISKLQWEDFKPINNARWGLAVMGAGPLSTLL